MPALATFFEQGPNDPLDSEFSIFISFFSIFSHEIFTLVTTGQNKELTAFSFFVSNKKFTLYCINRCKSYFKNLESFLSSWDLKPQITIKGINRA